jgi:hypothetical protein
MSKVEMFVSTASKFPAPSEGGEEIRQTRFGSFRHGPAVEEKGKAVIRLEVRQVTGPLQCLEFH